MSDLNYLLPLLLGTPQYPDLSDAQKRLLGLGGFDRTLSEPVASHEYVNVPFPGEGEPSTLADALIARSQQNFPSNDYDPSTDNRQAMVQKSASYDFPNARPQGNFSLAQSTVTGPDMTYMDEVNQLLSAFEPQPYRMQTPTQENLLAAKQLVVSLLNEKERSKSEDEKMLRQIASKDKDRELDRARLDEEANYHAGTLNLYGQREANDQSKQEASIQKMAADARLAQEKEAWDRLSKFIPAGIDVSGDPETMSIISNAVGGGAEDFANAQKSLSELWASRVAEAKKREKKEAKQEVKSSTETLTPDQIEENRRSNRARWIGR